ncbi:hypothetical protein QQS21_001820 [Conoideocrella luteorostrata]|uniref:Zn(2)-C6 fungal-type domain-containing protein n=1 Tax=Conoideocrella luteorostrata TaxID=1105319 RepID=A0AAJ0G377_9HYPO|nr:hypothetical protein QQS21_001820 [Conoideocrella luteorostrata]
MLLVVIARLFSSSHLPNSFLIRAITSYFCNPSWPTVLDKRSKAKPLTRRSNRRQEIPPLAQERKGADQEELNGFQWTTLDSMPSMSPNECDRIPTGCSQCQRKGVPCVGYRDPSALRFRDETTRITCKFEKKKQARPTFHTRTTDSSKALTAFTAPEGSTETLTSPSTQLLGSLQPEPTYPLRHNLQDVSIAYFVTSYIYATPYQGYVPAFRLHDLGTGDACSTAIHATALAALSRRVRSADHLKGSRQMYAMALSQVNDLLSKPESAILDRTLATVLVLGLFEAIVFEGDTAPTSWTAHTYGAMQLLRLRGPQQFKSPISRKMFFHASNNIKTSCIQRSVPVPDDLVALDGQIQKLHDSDEPSVKLSPLIQKVASIKVRAVADPDCNLVHEALKLDREIVAFAENPPEWMAYQVEPSSESPVWAYNRICHRYPDARVAKIWNAMRLVRFFLVIFIKDIASGESGNLSMDLSNLRVPDRNKTSSDYIAELREYARMNMEMVTTEVLATIPTFMDTGEFGKRFAAPARSLAWPLGVIKASVISSEPARKFAIKYLDMLAGDLNIPQAVHQSRSQRPLAEW